MIFGFFDKESIFCIVCISKFLVAGLPDTIKDCSCEAVYGEYFAASISEIDEYEHLEV
jgi:hypothetical protein